jgi:hypothetical protein
MTTPTGKGHGEHHQKLHPPFAQPDPGRRATPHMAAETSGESPAAVAVASFELPQTEDAELDTSDNMPSIERFVDDLPLINDFLLDSSAPITTPVQATTSDSGTDEGWADADWQSYDWSGLASLGAPAPEAAEAHAAWSSTNWDAGRGGRPESEHFREDEVAAALDEIARKIRSGELSLHQFRGSPPEAAIAAAFASLLRSRA